MSLIVVVAVFVSLLVGLAFVLKKSVELDMTAALLDRGAVSQRQEHMTRVMSSWDHWPSPEAWAELTGSAITTLRRGSFFGRMHIDTGAGQLTIFDWQVSMPSYGTPVCFQTVAVFAPTDIKAPEFFVQPRGTLAPIELANSLNSYRFIATHSDLDFTHSCQTCFEELVVRLFNSEIGQKKIEHITSKGWTVEWTGRQLIVFRVGQLVPPNKMKEFAAEVMEFAAMLGQGQEAVESIIDRKVDSYFERHKLQPN